MTFNPCLGPQTSIFGEKRTLCLLNSWS